MCLTERLDSNLNHTIMYMSAEVLVMLASIQFLSMVRSSSLETTSSHTRRKESPISWLRLVELTHGHTSEVQDLFAESLQRKEREVATP